VSDREVDRTQIEQFFNLLFRYADEGSYLALRIFDQFDRTKPALHTEGIRLNGDADAIITAACRVATRAATLSEPAIFAPPLATFACALRARTEDLCNGLTLSTELDEGDIAAGRLRLEQLLGPATVVMESGGLARDPNTDDTIPKLHLHWRLNEPTRHADDHQKLRTARWLAAKLSGGDPTAAPPSHPLRWPGSLNLKATPRLARIIAIVPKAEIDLNASLELLEDAIEAAGLGGPKPSGHQNGSGQASLDQIESALETISNGDVHYSEWVRLGYAIYAATGGTGLELFRRWSSKSVKHDDDETEATWARIGKAGPSRIGVGTIFFLAKQHGWRPGARPDGEDPPEPIDLQSVSPIIAELITLGTQDGRSVENRRKKLFEVVRYLHRRHDFASVLATLKAHPAGVQATYLTMGNLEDELRRICVDFHRELTRAGRIFH
jgi:hypothetical protein